MYMVLTTDGFFEVAIWPDWDLSRLSYQATSPTRTQSELCTAAPISSFVQCHIIFRLLPSSVTTFILTEIFWR